MRAKLSELLPSKYRRSTQPLLPTGLRHAPATFTPTILSLNPRFFANTQAKDRFGSAATKVAVGRRFFLRGIAERKFNNSTFARSPPPSPNPPLATINVKRTSSTGPDF
jgi:hypothetical protein